MIGTVEPAGESKSTVGHRAHPAAGHVIPRPALVERLGTPARVTVVSGPPGSGKTVLLRSWVSEAGLTERAAWVPAGPDERDSRRFWLSVCHALRRTAPGSALVQPLTAAPGLDGWTIVERLLTNLAPLDEPAWLVIDDVHELGPDALRQLELLIMRAPPALRFVLATRHDVRLGLHRLRLEGELAEIREPQLRFTVAEARELLAAAGAELPGPALFRLHERTEGWVAGLRLAALSLAGHPDPERFAVQFSGTERTVAEYLLAEVLDRQDNQVRRLLLRTSVLERVNGELAGLLTGDDGGERTLQDLEQANAFVVSLDPGRTWFRYHQMFAELLALELRRTAPGELTRLHQAAAGWFAAHGYPVEAIGHAQAAGDWETAARLLADHWPGLYLDGRASAIHDLTTGFPAGYVAAHVETAIVGAADELAHGSLEAAERYLGVAERETVRLRSTQHGQVQLLHGVVRLLVAHRRGNLPAVVEEAGRLQATADSLAVGEEDLRALMLITLGTTEIWAARFEDANRHLESGIALARRTGRPFLEFTGLAYQAAIEVYRSYAVATQLSTQAVALARRHGWTDESAAGQAYGILGVVPTLQGRLEQAEPWVRRAEQTVRAEAQPGTAMATYYICGLLELARGRDADALAAFGTAERLADRLTAPHHLLPRTRAFQLITLVRLGDIEQAGQVLAGLGGQDREHAELRIAAAVLRLAQNDPRAALAALAPVLDGCAPVAGRVRLAQAFLLEAIALDAAGDAGAADQALERALDCAEPDGVLLWFLLHPAPGLLERHARQRTAHAALIASIQSLLASPMTPPPTGPRPLIEPLSDSELRVLRYLPTNLTAPEIASELYVSTNTVKTHMRNLYAKLGTHRRAETVTRARDLGLLAPSPHRS
jgi:LuxR family transcriptional regulator, maltose regulon positive regulatory protein